MEQARNPNFTIELALLVLLATLWRASYTFIKLGVATIPPVTLIAARTLIAGLLLVAIMHWRGSRLPADAATWRRFCSRPASTA
jgi:drug/metabolite transporter (DMT)-like permease